MVKKDLQFEQLMQVYNHIGEEERHFNELELEYRKLASQWLLVALGAIGFVLTRSKEVPVNAWALVIGICLAASVGIFVLWLLDLKVYHELLHAAFREGVKLENEYPQYLPRIRNNMVKTQQSGDIVKRVIFFYFFSMLLLIFIANIAVWMLGPAYLLRNAGLHVFSLLLLLILYQIMIRGAGKRFASGDEQQQA